MCPHYLSVFPFKPCSFFCFFQTNYSVSSNLLLLKTIFFLILYSSLQAYFRVSQTFFASGPFLYVCSFLDQQPPVDQGLLINDVSRSRTTTQSSERVISPSQRSLPDNTQHSQQTNIIAPGGIRTHNLSRRAAADLRLRPRGYWDRLDPFGLRKITAYPNILRGLG